MAGFNNGLVALFNRTAKDLESPEWEKQAEAPVKAVAISKEARYFAVGANNDLHLFHHDVPIPIIYRMLLGDGDDDDDGNIAAIPFGNYYLIFVALGVISLIVIMKRKVIFSKK